MNIGKPLIGVLASGLMLISVPAMAADNAYDPAPAEGGVTWYWDGGLPASPSADQADAYVRIKTAMDKATARWNRLYPDESMSIRVAYRTGTPTAEGGPLTDDTGSIHFGKNRGFMVEGTALHEIGHVMGVGYVDHGEQDKCNGGVYSGLRAQLALKSLDGPDAVLRCGGGHIWPYGNNYATEWAGDAAHYEKVMNGNVKVVEALRQDRLKPYAAPTVGIDGDTTVDAGQPVDLTVSTGEADPQAEVTVIGLPEGLAYEDGRITGNGKAGSYELTVTADNRYGKNFKGTGEDTKKVTLAVADPEPVTHTVTFKSGGCLHSTQTVADGEALKNLPAPIRIGFDFGGWMLDGQPYDQSTPVTHDMVLEAKWTRSMHTVTFDTADGVTPDRTVGVAYGDRIALPADPTRDGYAFEGWFTDSRSTLKYEGGPVTGDMTLTAKWVPVNHTTADIGDNDPTDGKLANTGVPILAGVIAIIMIAAGIIILILAERKPR